MSEVTRGQVDNGNNSQSHYLNILNNIQSESLIYKSESIAIRNGNIRVQIRTQQSNEYRKENTGMQCWNRNRNRNRNRNYTLDRDIKGGI